MTNHNDIWSLNPLVIIRTTGAGVHIGELLEIQGDRVQLANARRLWTWNAANTLNEVSLHGVGSESKISEPVAQIMILGVHEIIPVSDKARKSLTTSRW